MSSTQILYNMVHSTTKSDMLKKRISADDFFQGEAHDALGEKLEAAVKAAAEVKPEDGEDAPAEVSKPPGPVSVMDTGIDNITLGWVVPKKSGKISSYIVVGMKGGSTEWEEFDVVNDTRYKISSVAQGEWTFGIIAVNAKGKSAPATLPMMDFDGQHPPMVASEHRITYEDYLATKPRNNDGTQSPERRALKQRRLTKRDLEVWEAVNKVIITDTEYTVKGLKPGSTPSFRVIAINDYGESRPSNVVGPVTCKDDIIFPGIEVLGFKEIENGMKLDIQAKITGNPIPEVEWLKNDQPITDPRVKVNNEVGSSQLIIDESVREDKGQYSVRATNAAGVGSKQIMVVILSKPGAPSGPITLQNCSASSQTITWLPPVDDGGCHISHYIAERCVTDRQYWAPVGEELKSCEVTSTELHKNKHYIYRVAAVNQHGQGPYLRSEPFVAKNLCELAGRMEPPIVEGVLRDSMTVRWDPPSDNGGAAVNGYILEKRTRIQRKWTRVIHELIPNEEYRVRGLNEGTEYLYRVAAVNAAGTAEFSQPSIGAIARPPIHPPSEPRNVAVHDKTDSTVNLRWNSPEADGGSKVRGYFIEKHYEGTRTVPEDPEKEPEELWEKVYGHEVRSHDVTVKDLDRSKKIKFRVLAVNEAGQSEPAALEDYVVVEEIKIEPEIKLDSLLKDGLTVKNGKQMRLVAYVTGRPEPTVSWTFKGEEVPELARIDSSVINHSLTIRSAEREHAGIYTITAEADGKSISADINVNVLSVPGIPIGPVNCTNIVKDSVTLEWERPGDNGGTEITNYI